MIRRNEELPVPGRMKVTFLLEFGMPLPDNKDTSSDTSDEKPHAPDEIEADESTANDESPSEVSLRINLLGKLIIPP